MCNWPEWMALPQEYFTSGFHESTISVGVFCICHILIVTYPVKMLYGCSSDRWGLKYSTLPAWGPHLIFPWPCAWTHNLSSADAFNHSTCYMLEAGKWPNTVKIMVREKESISSMYSYAWFKRAFHSSAGPYYKDAVLCLGRSSRKLKVPWAKYPLKNSVHH